MDSLRRRVTSSRSLDASAHIDPLRRDEAAGGRAGSALRPAKARSAKIGELAGDRTAEAQDAPLGISRRPAGVPSARMRAVRTFVSEGELRSRRAETE